MNAQSDLANKVADALHIAEGAKPIPLDEIPDVTVANDTIEAVPMEADDSILDFTEDVISPNEVTHENRLPVDTHDTVSTDPLPVSKNRKALSIPIEIPTLSFDGISIDTFKQLQQDDSSLQPLWEHAHNGRKQFFIIDGLLMCLTSTLNTVSHALVVPKQLRKQVLIAAHDGLDHGGINTTRTLLNKHFTWPGLSTDFKNHIQACPKCLKHTKSGGHKVPLMQPELICQRGEKIAVDIVGPLPTSKQKYRFILPSMEMATSYSFAVPLRNYTSEETAKAILSIISKGSNFLSVTLNHLYKKFGISKIKTSVYHPQSNGKLERFTFL